QELPRILLKLVGEPGKQYLEPVEDTGWNKVRIFFNPTDYKLVNVIKFLQDNDLRNYSKNIRNAFQRLDAKITKYDEIHVSQKIAVSMLSFFEEKLKPLTIIKKMCEDIPTTWTVDILSLHEKQLEKLKSQATEIQKSLGEPEDYWRKANKLIGIQKALI